MTRTPNGWDKRDYKLWSEIRQLPSYGLIARDQDNPMISRREVLALLELHAEQRFDAQWIGGRPEDDKVSEPQTSRDATARADSIEGEGR